MGYFLRIALYNRGYCLLHKPVKAVKSGGGIRGKINGHVSHASFRRLRKWCIQHDINSDCWGITLTVPGIDLLSIDEFKCIHHKLCVWANDNLVPLVWRVELQLRGQPHLHCVVFSSVDTVLRLFIQWYRLLDSLPLVYNPEFISSGNKDLVLISRSFLAGSDHAVDLQLLRGDFRAWRYLVSHMSKGKQDQLGFTGRNWGVCNRKLFTAQVPFTVDLTDVAFYRVRRWIRRLTRSRAFRGNVFMLGNPDTISRMIDLAVSDVPF